MAETKRREEKREDGTGGEEGYTILALGILVWVFLVLGGGRTMLVMEVRRASRYLSFKFPRQH